MIIPDPTAGIKRIRDELGAEDDFDIAKIFISIPCPHTPCL